MNWVSFSPSRCASRFIICAKTSSDPPTSSASATVASLPDCTIMPCSSSSTVTGFRGSMNIREPPDFHARCETVTVCSSVIAFFFSASKTRYAVISLVSDAGSIRSPAFCAAMVCPLW